MIELTITDTLLALVPLVFGLLICFSTFGKGRELSLAGARMVLQLIGIGYFLSILFEYHWPWIGLLVLTIMSMVAAHIAIRPLQRKTLKVYLIMLIALILSGCINLFWMLLVVMKSDPWYQPQLFIPLAGMVFANGMNTLSVGAERFETEQPHQHAVKSAFNAAMIPQINSLLAVGLVSLPGMMTGQILSGVSPLIAVRYQIMVMSMMIGTSAMGLWLYFKAYDALFTRQG